MGVGGGGPGTCNAHPYNIYIDRLNSQSFTATPKLYLVYHPGLVSEYTVHILLIYDMIHTYIPKKTLLAGSSQLVYHG